MLLANFVVILTHIKALSLLFYILLRAQGVKINTPVAMSFDKAVKLAHFATHRKYSVKNKYPRIYYYRCQRQYHLILFLPFQSSIHYKILCFNLFTVGNKITQNTILFFIAKSGFLCFAKHTFWLKPNYEVFILYLVYFSYLKLLLYS